MLSLLHIENIAVIECADISFDQGHKKKFVAVKDANFDIYKGETLSLVGESGSGKTTIIKRLLSYFPEFEFSISAHLHS